MKKTILFSIWTIYCRYIKYISDLVYGGLKMAEFREVIKQAERLCDSSSCSTCDLGVGNNGRGLLDCYSFRNKYPEEYESRVMRWAEEHPAKTNKQKLIEIVHNTFGKDIDPYNVNGCYGFECPSSDPICYECKHYCFWEKEYRPSKED